MSEERFHTTTDGCKLRYVCTGKASGKLVVLIHGWSGSSRSFDLVTPLLASPENDIKLVLVDLRFHGGSDKPSHGLHVHRLAADVKEILDQLHSESPSVGGATLVGTSMGCAVIWAFCELFGTKLLKGCVFVDQAPLQNRAPGWDIGSKGCYDSATLENLQKELRGGMAAFADGNLAFCANKPLSTEFMDLLQKETMLCDPEQLGTLMRDHTQLDWRATLPHINVPCLNLYGSDSKVFPVAGCAYVGEHIPNCKNKCYEGCNHWLYMENPEEFAGDLKSFVNSL